MSERNGGRGGRSYRYHIRTDARDVGADLCLCWDEAEVAMMLQ